MSGGNGTRQIDRFVPCTWTCGACGEHGLARPWQRPGETTAEAVSRFSRDVRGLCLEGCAFTATAATVEGARDAG